MVKFEQAKDIGIAEKISYTVILAFIIVLLCSQHFLPSEKVTHDFFMPFQASWERVLPDNTIFPVETLSSVTAEPMEPVYFRTKLPTGIKNHAYLLYKSNRQDVNFYIDRELRTEYTNRDTRMVGAYSPSAYVFVPLKESDVGKTLSFVTKGPKGFSGEISPIYYCTQIGAIRFLLAQHGPAFIFVIFLASFSFICVVICIIYSCIYKKVISTQSLAIGLFLNAIYLLTHSVFCQLIFKNYSVVSFSSMMLFSLQLLPFIFYIDRMQDFSNHRIFVVTEFFVLSIFCAVVVFQLLPCDCFNVAVALSFVEIFVIYAAIIYSFYKDYKILRLKKYHSIAVMAIIFMFVFFINSYFTIYSDLYNLDFTIFYSVIATVLFCLEIIKALKQAADAEKNRLKALEASATKSAFLANMSHEIRTPINSIIGMNEMILREENNPAILNYAYSVQNASKLLLEIINDILDFSKIEAGRLQIVPTEYHLAAMLTDIVHILKERAQKKNLNVVLKVSPTLPTVLYGDEVRIRQIMMNLISNAVKYTEKGSIVLELTSMRYGEIFDLQFSVRDTGIGIKKENLSKLFHEFTRIDEKNNYKIEGTGLGLTITKRLVDMMKGSITVESVYRQGSTFTVKIPQKIRNKEHIGDFEKYYELEKSRRVINRELFHAPSAKVLVVDDNLSNQLVVQELLKRTLVQVDVANTGRSCILRCREQHFDVIFMDDMMPDMNGAETLNMLREDDNSKCSDIPVIILTANAISGAKEKYLEEGFTDYLSKPIDSEKMEQLLAKYLPQKKLVLDFESSENEEKSLTERNDNSRKISIQGMDYEKLLERFSRKEDFIKNLFSVTYTEGLIQLKKMREFIKENKYKDYAIEVHALKSIYSNLCANQLADHAKQHEYAVKDENYEYINQDCELLFQEFETFLEQLKMAR